MQTPLVEEKSQMMDAVTLAHVQQQAVRFEVMRTYLLEHYLGRYIWLVGEEVLDSDVEFSVLFDRVVERVGDAPIFIRRVVGERKLPRVRSAVIR